MENPPQLSFHLPFHLFMCLLNTTLYSCYNNRIVRFILMDKSLYSYPYRKIRLTLFKIRGISEFIE